MLFHFSEDPTIQSFIPRHHPAYPDKPSMVWAIDEERAPLYFFPRDCPRIGYWAIETTTTEDQLTFFSHSTAKKVVAIEGKWLEKIMTTKLYVYHFPESSFYCLDRGAGYYVSHEEVQPIDRKPVGSLLQRLVEADVELRITPSLVPLKNALIHSSLHFSMVRMRNAQLL